MSQIRTKATTSAGTATSLRTDDAVVVSPSGGVIDLDGGNNVTTSGAGSAATIALTGTTDHALQLGNATGSLTSLLGTNNTALLGVTGLDPIFGTVPNATLTNSSMTFTSGNNITFTGSPVSLGGAGTIAVTGTTDHGVQVGNASGSLTSVIAGVTGTALIGVTGADPIFDTIPNAALDNSTITLNNGTNITITGSPISLGGSGTVALSGMINRALHVGNPSGGLTSLGVAANGQIPIGSGGLNPVLATITGGSNLNVANGGGSITVNLDNSVSVSGSMSAGTTMSASTTVTAGTGVTATTGNITASAGDVVVSAGNITIPATTSSSSGVIEQAGNRMFHTFNASGANNNLYIGINAGNFTSTTAARNVGIGQVSLDALTTGLSNTAGGDAALTDLTSGDLNCAFGRDALLNIITGDRNLGFGVASGENYTGAESSNIVIGNAGVNAESNVMRLGTHGVGAGQQAKCFIAGVRGVTTGNADAVAVLIDSGFQLGTVSSSIRVKKNVEDMGTATNSLLDLRPVNFDYINSKSTTDRRQYGLIAEEVEKIMPDLVVYNKTTLEPESVFYNDLPVMLLNEMKKMQKKIEALEKQILHGPRDEWVMD